MWVGTATICKLGFLGGEDKILTTAMLKVKRRIHCSVSLSILTDTHIKWQTCHWAHERLKKAAFEGKGKEHFISEIDKF